MTGNSISRLHGLAEEEREKKRFSDDIDQPNFFSHIGSGYFNTIVHYGS